MGSLSHKIIINIIDINIVLREGLKKKLEFSKRGREGVRKKKFQLFQKQCHSTQNAMIQLLPYIDPYVHGNLPIYSNCNIHHDLI